MTLVLLIFISIIISLISFPFGNAEITYFTKEIITTGNMFPENLILYLGENVFLKLREPLANQQKCEFSGPSNESDLKRISVDVSKGCELRIRNVTKTDEGFWRLTSIRENSIVRSVAYLKIEEKPIPKPVDDLNSPSDIVSPDNTKYCYVFRADSNKADFPQHNECIVPNIHLDPEAKGFWNVTAGVNGKTEEIKFNIYVDSKDEKLETLIEQNINTIILKCDVINIKRTMKFCRFARVQDNFGLNLLSGHGIGNYRYYGDGFNKGHCGVMITDPTTEDKTIWKCFIGLEDKPNITTTIGAILDLKTLEKKGLTADNVYGLLHNKIDLKCISDSSFGYCWFLNPIGTMISVSEQQTNSSNLNYQYNGSGFKLGQCGITIMNSTLEDYGIWSCHVGDIVNPQLESVVDIFVRVTTSNLVAIDQNKTANIEDSLLIKCSTIPQNTPLEHCRFFMPNGNGFSLNENVTSRTSISNNFYFDPNENLESGHCSVVIKTVSQEHNGRWVCAGKLRGWQEESFDSIEIQVITTGLSLAAVLGMSGGILIVIIVAAILIILRYKKRQRVASEEIEL